MNLFDVIPENLFSILASKNKRIYVDALFVIRESFKQEMSLPKQNLIVMIISKMEDEILQTDFEEEESRGDFRKLFIGEGTLYSKKVKMGRLDRI